MNQGKPAHPALFPLLLASSLTIMASAVLAPSLPHMTSALSHFSQADFWAKMTIAVPGIFIAVSSPLIGKLSDHSSNKLILLVSLLAFAVFGTLGWIFSTDLLGLLITRALLGIAVAGIMVSVTIIATELFEGPFLGKYMGLQAAFGSFGAVFFLALGGFLADVNWRAPFLLYAISLFVFPALYLSLNTVKVREKPTKKNEAEIISRPFILVCFLAFVEVMMLYLIPLQFPFLALELGQASSSQIGIVLSLVFFLLALVSMNYHKLQAKYSFNTLQTLGYFVIATGFLCCGLSTYYLFAVAGLLIAAVGFGLIRPNLLMWLFSFTEPSVRGRVMGIVTSFYFLAQFCSPLVFEPLVSGLGISYSFLVASSFCLLISLSMLGKLKTMLYFN